MLKWRCRLAATLALAIAACSSPPLGIPTAQTRAGTNATLDANACEGRSSETLTQLEACIRRATLWHRLTAFQRIADEHKGPDGHGNRNTGTLGYKASVDFVAGLMRRAGYSVTVQTYPYRAEEVAGRPELRGPAGAYDLGRDWFVARGSGSGSITAAVEPPIGTGCRPQDFASFSRGGIALLERGSCAFDTQIENAYAAGARAAVLFDDAYDALAYEARLSNPAPIPVAGALPYSIGARLVRQYRAGLRPQLHIDVRKHIKSGIDYNLIADSPYGDASSVVVVDAHLDAIYGAGMLDNASGSTTILEIALNLAKTPTRNRLRYIWFGGEELGLLGSRYYTQHLSTEELHRIAFDVDADVTATPNFDILIADARRASNVKSFPPNVVPQSKIGNAYFADYFKAGGTVFRAASFGNDGTDSNAFSVVGVPNTGILTEQDCCKHPWEKHLWGGFLGNYEGDIPSFDGGCVDKPSRWCDNLANNDPFVLELISKAVGYVTFNLANHSF